MKNVLILDTETTAIDPSVASIVEVGAILYSIPHASIVSAWSSLVSSPTNAGEEVNRIPAALLAELDGRHRLEHVVRILRAMAQHVDAVIAYNAEFDRGFISIANDGPLLGANEKVLPWICAMKDIHWPRKGSSKALTSVALTHDLGVGHAHRALADCELIARLLTRSRELGADLAVMMANAMIPKQRVVAVVSYDDRAQASGAGFRWDGERKEWWARLTDADAAALPFKTIPRPLETDK